MNKQDVAKLRSCIAAMFKVFGHEATDASFDGYMMGLVDLPVATTEAAVIRAIRECKFMPKPAELRTLAGVSLTGNQRAVAAWNDVQRAIALGPYKHIDFSDKLCNAVVRNLGGWPSFCSRFASADDEKWVRNDFIRAYEAFVSTGVSGDLIQPLPGLSQAEVVNGVLGDPVPRKISCDEDRLRLPCAVKQSGYSLVNKATGELQRIGDARL